MIVENIYTFGQGHISCGMGIDKKDFSPVIIISKMENKQIIGTDLMEQEINHIEPIALKFNNIEGLNVLKEMVKQVEKNLKK